MIGLTQKVSGNNEYTLTGTSKCYQLDAVYR
jgi:hypothetical protein